MNKQINIKPLRGRKESMTVSKISELSLRFSNYEIEYSRRAERLKQIDETCSQATVSLEGTVKKANELSEKVASNLKQFTAYVDSLKTLQQSVDQELNKIKDNYEDYLKIAQPAEIWRKQVANYRIFGIVYGIMAIVFCVAFGLLLHELLVNSDVIPLFNATKVDFSTIRASLVFILFSSIFGYIIHFLSRLCISSFHLARDANERIQLTNYYISLIKLNDKAVGDKERRIMLYSIFTRSESGLLKGTDSSVNSISIGDLIPKGD